MTSEEKDRRDSTMLLTVFWLSAPLEAQDLNAHFQLQNLSKCFDVDLFTQITSGDSSSATSQQGRLEDGKFAKLTLQPNFGLGLSSSKPAREKEPDQYRESLTIKLTLSVKTIHVPSTFGT